MSNKTKYTAKKRVKDKKYKLKGARRITKNETQKKRILKKRNKQQNFFGGSSTKRKFDEISSNNIIENSKNILNQNLRGMQTQPYSTNFFVQSLMKNIDELTDHAIVLKNTDNPEFNVVLKHIIFYLRPSLVDMTAVKSLTPGIEIGEVQKEAIRKYLVNNRKTIEEIFF